MVLKEDSLLVRAVSPYNAPHTLFFFFFNIR